jgi:hypothetical protein
MGGSTDLTTGRVPARMPKTSERDRRGTTLASPVLVSQRRHRVGLMFWFTRKKLVGSYLFLTSTRRS